jgi:hypothetical protein
MSFGQPRVLSIRSETCKTSKLCLLEELHTTKKNEGKPLLFKARPFHENKRVYVYINDLSKYVMLAENECV